MYLTLYIVLAEAGGGVTFEYYTESVEVRVAIQVTGVEGLLEHPQQAVVNFAEAFVYFARDDHHRKLCRRHECNGERIRWLLVTHMPCFLEQTSTQIVTLLLSGDIMNRNHLYLSHGWMMTVTIASQNSIFAEAIALPYLYCYHAKGVNLPFR